jgi:hypothetical protein
MLLTLLRDTNDAWEVRSTSPRAGGEAAKFGARFEELWTVKYLLDVLLGRADAVTVEPVDPLADHVEFFVERDEVGAYGTADAIDELRR